MSGDFILRCPSCGTRNRIPAERVGQTAKCGKCKAAISTDSLNIDRPVTVTDATFQQEVIQSPLPVLLDCWAPWCGPCKMITPILDELARTYQGRLKIAKLNVDENPSTAAAYGIQSIPTLLFVRNGAVVDTQVGVPSKNALVQRLNALL